MSVLVVALNSVVLQVVGADLYNTRREQALEDSLRATAAAERSLKGMKEGVAATPEKMVQLITQALGDTSTSDLFYVFAFTTSDGVAVPLEETKPYSSSPLLQRALSRQLLTQVMAGGAPQYYQSVEFRNISGDASPGIVVGSVVTKRVSGPQFGVVIGYDLSESEDTLEFIQRTIFFSGTGLLLLTAIVVAVMTRLATRPMSELASISLRIRDGDDTARMPVQSDEHMEVLRRNFNEMADTLHARIQELNEISMLEQRFVSDVSHELRTPLTTIKLSLAMLQTRSAGFDDSSKRALTVLSEQVTRFEQLLTDLLEISRHDAGQVALDLETVRLTSLVKRVVDDLRPLYSSEIVVESVSDAVWVTVDPRRVRRIVSNLVSNAIEHGEGEPVVVCVAGPGQRSETLHSVATSPPNFAQVVVRDFGVGLNAEQQKRVFDRFWRADPARQRTIGGSGLGLSIALADARLHGGDIQVESAPGEGACFTLLLPCDEEHMDDADEFGEVANKRVSDGAA